MPQKAPLRSFDQLATIHAQPHDLHGEVAQALARLHVPGKAKARQLSRAKQKQADFATWKLPPTVHPDSPATDPFYVLLFTPDVVKAYPFRHEDRATGFGKKSGYLYAIVTQSVMQARDQPGSLIRSMIGSKLFALHAQGATWPIPSNPIAQARARA